MTPIILYEFRSYRNNNHNFSVFLVFLCQVFSGRSSVKTIQTKQGKCVTSLICLQNSNSTSIYNMSTRKISSFINSICQTVQAAAAENQTDLLATSTKTSQAAHKCTNEQHTTQVHVRSSHSHLVILNQSCSYRFVCFCIRGQVHVRSPHPHVHIAHSQILMSSTKKAAKSLLFTLHSSLWSLDTCISIKKIHN